MVKEIKEFDELSSKIRTIVRKYQLDGQPITIDKLAKKVRKPQQKVYDTCEDLDFCINVGIQVGGGIYEFKTIGECTVEDLDGYEEN